MLVEFATGQRLGAPLITREREGAVHFVSAEFARPNELICVWYVSDGRAVALVTYVAESAYHRARNELAEATSIVESLEFP